jgi:FKBP-type peptidyl-prolyl cis-trans isomerase
MRVAQMVLLLAAALAAGCQRPRGHDGSRPAPGPTPGAARPSESGGGLGITELTVGGGAEAREGRTVAVHYSGLLPDGRKFDSSYERGRPIEFVLGKGMVIPGWEQGIRGMKVGGRRKLVIPPALAYGDRGKGEVIPPNATLVFEVELMDVR